HYTAKCPYKDQLGGLENAGASIFPGFFIPINFTFKNNPFLSNDGTPAPEAPAAPAKGSVYVPPSMCNSACGPGESMHGTGGHREDLPTLCVTNISEDTQENYLRELFGVFGHVACVFGCDHETGADKGFAFVGFDDRGIAQCAMEKVSGKGYNNLILGVQWSRE
ncbi:hypothetical protein FISHEDRAFT_32832, partial [Fistulina hepatica ATCC 64428]